MRSMQWQLGILGTISAFAFRHRETKKNLCRDGRSQDLPSTDLQPAVRHMYECMNVSMYVCMYLRMYVCIYFCNICSSMHRNSRLKKPNKMQQRADIHLLLNYSTCFGRLSRPSSGVHETVVAASGTDHTIWGASFFKRDHTWSRLKRSGCLSSLIYLSNLSNLIYLIYII